MRLLVILTVFTLTFADYNNTHDLFALHLDPSASPEHIAQALGAGVQHEGPIGELAGHHKFSVPRERRFEVESLLADIYKKNALQQRGEDVLDGKILWAQKLALKKQKRLQKRIPPPPDTMNYREASQQKDDDPLAVQTQKSIAETLGITDPLFHKQWHLFNTVYPGQDTNVTGLWLEGITGEGTVTAIIDDGLDTDSADLRDNYYARGSYNFNDKNDDPRPRSARESHGTRCAGEVAAGKNSVCGVGMAYDGKVAGLRILAGLIDESDEAAALNYAYQDNQIYSCSWGPVDDGKTMEAPGPLFKRALINGVQNGRQGKGSIFVFSAGNGGFNDDNCNFDGYASSIYSITVGAITRAGKHPSYSESCSALLVVTYASDVVGYINGGGDAIYTTDIGVDACTDVHGGTSAAGPLAAGAIALALSVRPELTWRDVQYLLVETAVQEGDDWQATTIGRKFSHDWGYGKIDAYALVQRAKEWPLVKPQAWYHSSWLKVRRGIPQGAQQGLASTFEVTREAIQKANIARLEHVTVTMNINHTRRGDISVDLRSPEGIISHLSTPRRLDDEEAGYVDWTFMGESGIGTWTITVRDSVVNDFSGIFVDWRLNLWGEALDAASQTLHPFADEDEDAVAATIVDSEVGLPVSTGQKPPTTAIDSPDRAEETLSP
ncbi:hypothetical protein VTN96DRAFT_3619 [Rasamsonia emersonii]